MFSGFLQSFSQPGRALFALAVCAATFPAAGAINVTYVGIDSETGGDYRTADYGNCFSVISQASPRTQIPEVEVGPNLYSWTIDELVLNDDGVLVPNPSYGQYDNRCSFDMTTIARDENVSNCLGKTPGILIPERAGIDSAVCITERGAPTMRPVYFDFRLHLLGEFSAYAWSFLEPDFDGVDETFEVIEWNDPDIYPVPIPGLPNRPASQFNACLTADQGGAPAVFRAGTFDNGEYEFDPLTGIVHIKSGGTRRSPTTS